MYKKIDNKAFTFVELIVVVIILWILWTIGFTSYVGSLANWRDTSRKASFAEIFGAMKTYKQKKWSFPIPNKSFSWTNNSSNIVFWQWKLTKNVALSTIDNIPYDPKIKIPYLYSITKNRQEFEIAWTLENNDWDKPLSLLVWNYKSVAENVLPTIIVATWTTLDISDSNNKKLFIFDKQSHNLAYDFDWNTEPTSDGTDFDILLQEAKDNWVFIQNSDFETCSEIRKAWKSIWDWEYQIRTNTGALTNTWCTWM